MPSAAATSACCGEGVEAAHAVHGDAERVAQRERGDQADPQPGERPGAGADGDVGEVGRRRTGSREGVAHQRCELLGVRPGVDLDTDDGVGPGASTATPIAEVEVSIARVSTAHRPG